MGSHKTLFLLGIVLFVSFLCIEAHDVRHDESSVIHRLGEGQFEGGHSSVDPSTIKVARACETCADNNQCCDQEHCCGGSNGTTSSCCPFGSTCCNDTCCFNSSESCCPDIKNGGVCCLLEETFCCPADYDVGLPSRCCPRWYVCCTEGEYGCCEPITGKPMQADTTAYAIYADGEGDVYSLTIDIASGSFTSKKVDFQDYEEMPRNWVFNPDKNVFYLVQANFTVPGNEHVISLYTVDPTTGDITKTLVSGAVEDGQQDVTGFEYLSSNGAIIFSTMVMSSNGNLTGYNFYKLNPSTSQATLISQFTDVTADNYYAGYFDTLSVDGTTAYRVGYQDIATGANFGLGITDISKAQATTQWVINLPIPGGLDPFESINVYGPDSFISLAPDQSSGNLNVVLWSITSQKSTILGAMSNGNNVPEFGPVLEYLNNAQNLYGTLVVYDSFLSDLDRWALTTTSLPGGQTTEVVLYPWILAKINSMVALGFS